MTPHGIIEDMTYLERIGGKKFVASFDMDRWEAARQMVSEAVHFEFAQAAPLSEHQDFGNDLLDRGLFRLPFETVLFTGCAMPKTGVLVKQTVGAEGLHRLDWFVVGPTILPSGAKYGVPILAGALKGLSAIEEVRVEWFSLTTEHHHSRKTNKQWDEDDYEKATGKALSFILASTTLLMSKDVDVTTEVPSPAFNRAREKKLRPPARERRIVKIKLDRRAAYANAADDFGRSSPRMHFRRGHFRTLQSGSVIPVAPSIVNASPDSKPAAKAYEVSQ